MKKEFCEPLFLPPFKGRVQAAYNNPLFIQAISDCRRLLSEEQTEILIDRRNRVGVVSLPQQDGLEVDIVIKEFHSVGLKKLKSLVLPGKALKAWQGCEALVEREIETPPPVAYLEERKGLFLVHSFFLTERIKDVTEIRFLFFELNPPELRKLLISLGQHLALCHKKGILHCDLSDGNVLVKKEESGKCWFYLIDTNRIKVKRRVGLLMGIRNLVRLGIPPEFQRFFLEQYLETSRVKDSFWFWYKMNKMRYTFFVELKKRLKLRQLARKLKIQ